MQLSKQGGAGRALSKQPDPPAFQAVQDFHTNADTDSDSSSLHHTLGGQGNQATPGDHTHDGGSSSPLFQGQNISGTRGSTAYLQSIEALLVKLGAGNQAV